jgi:hypothetical protein
MTWGKGMLVYVYRVKWTEQTETAILAGKLAGGKKNGYKIDFYRLFFQLNGPDADLAKITLAAADHELKR